MAIPDGFFTEGLIFFGRSLSRETLLAKGFYVELQDQPSSTEAWLDQRNRLRILLGLIGNDMSLQIQWSVDSNYRQELEQFHKTTLEKADNRWCQFNRSDRYVSYLEEVEQGKCRRERLAMFLTKKCNTLPKRGFKISSQIQKYLQQQAQTFSERIDMVSKLFPEARIIPMDDKEHYYYWRRFLNPSLALTDLDPTQRYAGFDSGAPILEQVFRSNGILHQSPDDASVYLHLDDYYHSIIALTRWPQKTFPGIIGSLCKAINLEYSITQNVYPLAIQKVIEKEEKIIERLHNESQQASHYSVTQDLRRRMTKVDALMAGYTLPFKVLTVIRAWDRTRDGLITKTSQLKTAIQAMAGAQYHVCSLEGQAKNLFFETYPGWTGGKVREWDMNAESSYFPDMIPFSSTETGWLDTAEALYHGNQNNIVGLRTFAGDTPQNAVLIGMPGAGKSVFIIDLLTQTDCFYDYTAIVEDGLSYGVYSQLNGSDPIKVTTDGEFTFNCFDTQGLPFSNSQKSTMIALFHKMSGVSKSEEVNMMRKAIFDDYIEGILWDCYKDWELSHEKEAHRIARRALAISMRRKEMATGSSFMDAFLDVREWEKKSPQEVEKFINKFHEDEVVRFSKSPQSATQVRNLAFSEFAKTQHPTLGKLVNAMLYGQPRGKHDKEEVKSIANRLKPWCRNGANGILFDGVSNVDLKGRVTHFELGYIPKANEHLRAVISVLISNYVRQHIITLPRGMRKRVVWEEVSKFLEVPGGDAVVAEMYAQMRKYSCWVISILQTYQQLSATPLSKVIFDSSKLVFLMKQKEQESLMSLARNIKLTDRVVQAVQHFPLPENQRGEKAGYLMVFEMDSGRCVCTKNISCPEMLYVASSSGSIFDQRANDLSKFKDTYEGVMELTKPNAVVLANKL